MVKKNRHCASRKKRERILHAQQHKAAELASLAEPARRIVRVQPQLREPPASEIHSERPNSLAREIFLVDLTKEDTVPYLNEENDRNNRRNPSCFCKQHF